MTFDKFEPFNGVTIQKLRVSFDKYIVWQDGSIIDEGFKTTTFTCTPTAVYAGNKALINLDDITPFANHISTSEMTFDIFITATDRLQFWNIPTRGNGDKSPAISMMKMVVGATRGDYDFARREPYVCNLFLVNQEIAKVTFSFVNPEKEQIELLNTRLMAGVVPQENIWKKAAKDLGLI